MNEAAAREGREDPMTERAPVTDASELAQRERMLRQQNAEVQRELLAARLGVPMEEIKPCVALMGGQPEGRRAEIASVIAYELAKLGVPEEQALSYLGWYVGKCDQPPIADGRFTDREARAILRSVYRQKASGRRIHGYGCIRRSSPLLEFCPYGADLDADNRFKCPYVSRRMVKPDRRRMASLVGVANLLHKHLRPGIPDGWRRLAATRRALLYFVLATLEVERGHSGGELWTSERALHAEFPLPITRTTIRGDLAAMHAAGWIKWTRGRDHRNTAASGRSPLGTRVLRLFPGDARLAIVAETFPGSEVER
jgi:hypothetical protein